MSWPSLILPSRVRQPADIVETSFDVAAEFDRRTFQAEALRLRQREAER
jgi:hypothetical protein